MVGFEIVEFFGRMPGWRDFKIKCDPLHRIQIIDVNHYGRRLRNLREVIRGNYLAREGIGNFFADGRIRRFP